MSFLERIKLKIAISRIIKMEKFFDELQLAFSRLNKDFLSDKKLKQKLNRLISYYESGKWLKDYQLDEQNKLPKNLKRGILSQDGIYNFLCEVESREV
jgi:hypothetical protein